MIKNKTRKSVVAKGHLICADAWSKARGLMLRPRRYVEKNSLVFVFDDDVRASLHMFFVFFPIDLIFLDERKQVVEIKERFRPFTAYAPKKYFRYVVEVPCGAVEKSRTSVGDDVWWD